MATNFIINIPETLGSTFKFKEFRDKKKFNTDDIIGTSVIVLDSFGNEQSVTISKLAENLPILNTLKVFDDIEFSNLEGKVFGTSQKDSTFVQLRLSLTADSLRKVGGSNGN